MAKLLTPDENTRLSNYWKRQAFTYTMKAHAGDQGPSLEMVRIHALNETLQMLGYDAKFSIDYSEMQRVGDDLYKQGFRNKNGQLEKTVVSRTEVI